MLLRTARLGTLPIPGPPRTEAEAELRTPARLADASLQSFLTTFTNLQSTELAVRAKRRDRLKDMPQSALASKNSQPDSI